MTIDQRDTERPAADKCGNQDCGPCYGGELDCDHSGQGVDLEGEGMFTIEADATLEGRKDASGD